MNRNHKIAKFIYNSYKRTINWGKLYKFFKSFIYKSQSYKTTNKLPQIYNFACLQAKKEQITCPYVTKSTVVIQNCVCFQRKIQSHEMNVIKCFNLQPFTKHAAFQKQEHIYQDLQLKEASRNDKYQRRIINQSLTITVSLKHKCLGLSINQQAT